MTLVVGLGSTGVSCARFLTAAGEAFAVADSRAAPPGLATLRRELPRLDVRLGDFEPDWFAGFRRLLLSPGVARDEPAVRAALAAGREVIGDVELFARNCQAPVVAITGSNGKSTVTTLLQRMLTRAGQRALAGANLGPPALELLRAPTPDYYVLELSSFQLETLLSLRPAAAALINLSPDHLDRYASANSYAQAKARVYRNARWAIYNADDRATRGGLGRARRRNSFTLGRPRARQFGVRREGGEDWLAQGARLLLPVRELALRGRHNRANALAALALLDALGVALEPALAELREFGGLAHRMQLLGNFHGVDWINDSKGTNVGATVAALDGLHGRVVLIAGGDGKGADFTPLRDAVQGARAVVLIGRDAPRLRQALQGAVSLVDAADMVQAVDLAAAAARPGDTVLLSPACASFDMFANYQQRGEAFAAAVAERIA